MGQVIVAVASVQVVFSGLAALAAPLHAAGVDRFGPTVAACLLSSGAVLFAHLVGVVMTVPALVGVKFWKIQVKRVATFQQLRGSIPLILLNCAISMAGAS